MPTGVLLVAERTITIAGTVTPSPGIVLDVGCGYGKHGVLLREYLHPTPIVHGVEAWEPYVTANRLRGIYDKLIVGDVLEMTKKQLDKYDMVVMGDVIEHLEKEAAIELLSRIRGWVVIATPVEHFHTDDGLPPTEAHVSHWTRGDFEATGRLDHYEECYGAIVTRLIPL